MIRLTHWMPDILFLLEDSLFPCSNRQAGRLLVGRSRPDWRGGSIVWGILVIASLALFVSLIVGAIRKAH